MIGLMNATKIKNRKIDLKNKDKCFQCIQDQIKTT